MASNANGPAAPDKPKDKVFANPELFGEILAHITICDLAFAHQVCKAWSHAVEQSLVLQQKLFLTPFEDSALKPDVSKMHIEHGCVFPAVLQVTDETIEPMALQISLIEPYTNDLGNAKQGP